VLWFCHLRADFDVFDPIESPQSVPQALNARENQPFLPKKSAPQVPRVEHATTIVD